MSLRSTLFALVLIAQVLFSLSFMPPAAPPAPDEIKGQWTGTMQSLSLQSAPWRCNAALSVTQDGVDFLTTQLTQCSVAPISGQISERTLSFTLTSSPHSFTTNTTSATNVTAYRPGFSVCYIYSRSGTSLDLQSGVWRGSCPTSLTDNTTAAGQNTNCCGGTCCSFSDESCVSGTCCVAARVCGARCCTSDPVKSTMTGAGLSVGRYAQAATFQINGIAADGLPVTIGGEKWEVTLEPTSQCAGCVSITAAVKDNNDGTYTVTYSPTFVGVYTMYVVLKTHDSYGWVARTSTVTVYNEASELSTISGPGLANAIVSSPATFSIVAKDLQGVTIPTGGDTSAFAAVLTMDNCTTCPLVTATLTDNGGGSYTASYIPTVGGTGKLAVSVTRHSTLTTTGSFQLQGSPFSVRVVSSMSPNNSVVTGSTVAARVGQNAVAYLYPKTANNEAITTGGEKVTGPITPATTGCTGCTPIPVSVSEVQTATGFAYALSYVPQTLGVYSFRVLLNGDLNVAQSPYTLIVSASATTKSTFTYQDRIRVNSPSTINIQARDAAAAIITNGGDMFQVKMVPRCVGCEYAPAVPIVDNANGQYTGTFSSTTAGDYDVNVYLSQNNVLSLVGTYLLQVSDLTNAAQSLLTAVAPPTADVNIQRSFTITARDSASRNVLVGGDAFQVNILGTAGCVNCNIPANVTDQGTGGYVVTFTPTVEGTYLATVLLGSQQVAAPLSFLVQGDRALSPVTTTVTGPTQLAVEQDPLAVTVSAKNVGGKAIPVGGERITACFCCDCAGSAEYAFTDHGNGNYSLSKQMLLSDLVPAGTLKFTYTVRWYSSNGIVNLGKSPYTVSILSGRLSVQHSIYTGQNEIGKSTKLFAVTMQALDAFGYKITRTSLGMIAQVSFGAVNTAARVTVTASKTTIDFTPAAEGTYFLTLQSTELTEAPLTMPIRVYQADIISLSNSTVTAADTVWLSGTSYEVGLRSVDYFGALTNNIGSPVAQLTLKYPDATTSNFKLTRTTKGIFRAHASSPIVGAVEIGVTARGSYQKYLSVNVMPGADAANSILVSSPVTVGTPLTATVIPRAADGSLISLPGSNFTVDFIAPKHYSLNDSTLDAQTLRRADNSYAVSVTPRVSGSWTLTAWLTDGSGTRKSLPAITVLVSPGDLALAKSVPIGSTITLSKVGVSNVISIAARDLYNNTIGASCPGYAVTGSVQIQKQATAIELASNCIVTGVFQFKFTPPAEASYPMTISYKDQPPLTFTVQAWNPDTVYLPNTEINFGDLTRGVPILVGLRYTINLRLRDRFNDSRTVGGDKVAITISHASSVSSFGTFQQTQQAAIDNFAALAQNAESEAAHHVQHRALLSNYDSFYTSTKDNGDGSYESVVIFESAGDWNVIVTVNGQQPPNSSVQIEVHEGLSARILDSLAGVVIDMQVEVSFAATPEASSSDCSLILTPASVAMLGDPASHPPICAWPTPQFLYAYFGGGSQILPLESLTLKKGVIASTDVSVNVLPAVSPSAPTVTLSLASQVGDCATVILESFPTALGGRNGTFVWGVFPAINGLPSVRPNPLGSRSVVFYTGTNDALQFSSDLLTNGVTYQFAVQVTNYLNISSAIVYGAMTKVSGPLPIVQLTTSPILTITPADRVNVDVSSYGASCSNATGPTSQKWSLESGPSVPEEVLTNRQLTITPGTLAPGTDYAFGVTVTDSAMMTSRAKLNITVVPSRLVALIDGSSRDVPLTSPTVIDGALSYDPDKSKADMTYKWKCTVGTTNTNCALPPSVVMNKQSVNLPAEALPVGQYKFSLEVTKPSRATGSTSVVLNIRDANFPLVFIRPLFSSVINPAEKIVLQGSAISPSNSPLTYRWTVDSGNFDLSDREKLRTWTNNSLLVINPSQFGFGTKYIFRLQANDSQGTGFATISFTTGVPPTGGRITVSPSSGLAGNTVFVLTASGWTASADQMPLQFYFKYIEPATKSSRPKTRILTGVSTASSTAVVLPPDATTVAVVVRDRYGLENIASAPVTVEIQEDIDLETLVQRLINNAQVAAGLDQWALARQYLDAATGVLNSKHSYVANNDVVQSRRLLRGQIINGLYVLLQLVRPAEFVAECWSSSIASVSKIPWEMDKVAQLQGVAACFMLFNTSVGAIDTYGVSLTTAQRTIDAMSNFVFASYQTQNETDPLVSQRNITDMVFATLDSVSIGQLGHSECGEDAYTTDAYYVHLASQKVLSQDADNYIYRPSTSAASISLPNATVLFGSNPPPQCLDTQAMEMRYNMYSYAGASNANVSSAIVTFAVRSGTSEYEFSGLSRPVLLTIPHLSRDQLKQDALSRHLNHTFDPVCRYFNLTSQQWSTDGCTVQSASDNVTICACNHMTDFAVFLPANNLGLFLAPDIFTRFGPDNYVTLVVLGSLIVLYIIAMIITALLVCPAGYAVFAHRINSLPLIIVTDDDRRSKSRLTYIRRLFIKNLKFDHPWISIATVRPYMSYTRSMRITVFFITTLAEFTANAIFYGTDAVNIGQFIVAGLISMAIVIPGEIILAAIFKVVGSVVKEADDMNAQPTAGPRQPASIAASIANTSDLSVKGGSLRSIPVVPPTPTEPTLRDKLVSRLATNRHGRNAFMAIPYTCAFLCFALSAYYILVFGLFFQNIKALDWLASNAVSFFVGGLLMDPLICLVKVLFCVVVCNQKPKRLRARKDMIKGIPGIAEKANAPSTSTPSPVFAVDLDNAIKAILDLHKSLPEYVHGEPRAPTTIDGISTAGVSNSVRAKLGTVLALIQGNKMLQALAMCADGVQAATKAGDNESVSLFSYLLCKTQLKAGNFPSAKDNARAAVDMALQTRNFGVIFRATVIQVVAIAQEGNVLDALEVLEKGVDETASATNLTERFDHMQLAHAAALVLHRSGVLGRAAKRMKVALEAGAQLYVPPVQQCRTTNIIEGVDVTRWSPTFQLVARATESYARRSNLHHALVIANMGADGATLASEVAIQSSFRLISAKYHLMNGSNDLAHENATEARDLALTVRHFDVLEQAVLVQSAACLQKQNMARAVEDLETGYRLADESQARTMQLHLAIELAAMCKDLGPDCHAATVDYTEIALQTAATLRDPVAEKCAIELVALLLRDQPDRLVSCLNMAAAALHTSRSPVELAVCATLARVCHHLGDKPGYKIALAQARAAGKEGLHVRSVSISAALAAQDGDLAAAIAECERGVTDALNDIDKARLSAKKAKYQREAGDHPGAVASLHYACELLKLFKGEEVVNGIRGKLLIRFGKLIMKEDLPEALDSLKMAVSLLPLSSPRRREARIHVAILEEQMGRLQAAADSWIDVVRESRSTRALPEMTEARMLAKIGQLAVQQGKNDAAIVWLQEAYRLVQDEFTNEAIGILIGVADAYANMNQTKLANNVYGKCLDRCDSTTQPLIIMRLADNYVKRDEKHSAVALLHDAAHIAQQAGHLSIEIAYLCKLHVINSLTQDAHGLAESEKAINEWATRSNFRGEIDASSTIEAALVQASQILVDNTLTSEESRLTRFNINPSLRALKVVPDNTDTWDSVSMGDDGEDLSERDASVM